MVFNKACISHTKILKQVSSIFGLMYKQTSRGVINLKTKEIMKQSKILEIKINAQQLNDTRNKSRTVTCDDNIIDIEQQMHNERLMPQDE